jgi:hypothetical protein
VRFEGLEALVGVRYEAGESLVAVVGALGGGASRNPLQVGIEASNRRRKVVSRGGVDKSPYDL